MRAHPSATLGGGTTEHGEHSSTAPRRARQHGFIFGSDATSMPGGPAWASRTSASTSAGTPTSTMSSSAGNGGTGDWLWFGPSRFHAVRRRGGVVRRPLLLRAPPRIRPHASTRWKKGAGASMRWKKGASMSTRWVAGDGVGTVAGEGHRRQRSSLARVDGSSMMSWRSRRCCCCAFASGAAVLDTPCARDGSCDVGAREAHLRHWHGGLAQNSGRCATTLQLAGRKPPRALPRTRIALSPSVRAQLVHVAIGDKR